MDTNEPFDIVDIRMRVFVMGDLKKIAEATDLAALYDTELCINVMDYAEIYSRNPAMTDVEHEAALKVAEAISPIFNKAFLIKRDRIGGKVVHGLDPEDLAELGWFTTVQPLAREAWEIFQQRGWMNEDDC